MRVENSIQNNCNRSCKCFFTVLIHFSIRNLCCCSAHRIFLGFEPSDLNLLLSPLPHHCFLLWVIVLCLEKDSKSPAGFPASSLSRLTLGDHTVSCSYLKIINGSSTIYRKNPIPLASQKRFLGLWAFATLVTFARIFISNLSFCELLTLLGTDFMSRFCTNCPTSRLKGRIHISLHGVPMEYF